jgi:O-6-methylguanine DNA methyltransferase
MIHVYYTQTVNDTWLALACCDKQVVVSSFADTKQQALSNILSKLPLNASFQVVSTLSIFAETVFGFMEFILEGKDLPTFTLDFVMDNLPKYTCMVLNAVMQIPVGYVSTYGAVAKAIGGGPRAVGNIMAGNMFAPFVPCHRVVKTTFSLGGYGGGLKTKYALLMKEKRAYVESENVIIKNSGGGGGVLQIFPVELTLSHRSNFLFAPHDFLV